MLWRRAISLTAPALTFGPSPRGNSLRELNLIGCLASPVVLRVINSVGHILRLRWNVVISLGLRLAKHDPFISPGLTMASATLSTQSPLDETRSVAENPQTACELVVFKRGANSLTRASDRIWSVDTRSRSATGRSTSTRNWCLTGRVVADVVAQVASAGSVRAKTVSLPRW
jgi:hypothetical protein